MKTSKLSDLVELAKADLQKRLKRQSDAGITVVSAEYVSWRSAAMGCPYPDRAYPMVITPGALIRLSVDGETYNYHSGRRGPPFMCEAPGQPESPAPKTSGHDPNDPT